MSRATSQEGARAPGQGQAPGISEGRRGVVCPVTTFCFFTRNHLDPLFRAVSRGSRVPRGGVPGSPGSVLRRLEKVGEGRGRLDKVRESLRMLEKVSES